MASKEDLSSEKRKSVKVTLIQRTEKGPECYALLDHLVETCRPDLVTVRIALAFRTGWKPDKDGQLKAGKCCKPNEVSHELMAYDIVILLNEKIWPHLKTKEKEELVFHEMQHIVVVLDETTGQTKLDDRNRTVVRLRHHDIEEFYAVRKRYGHDNLGGALSRIWKDVRLGIELVQSCLKVRANGRPRLTISPSCPHLIREMIGYRWAELEEPLLHQEHKPPKAGKAA